MKDKKISSNFNIKNKFILLNKICSTLFIFLILFITFNFIFFFTVIMPKCNKKPFSEAKMYMYSAFYINTMYIFPLSTFGLKNPLTSPFYFLRNAIYEKGLSLYPKNEGEKEIWWWNIKFGEFRQIINPRIEDYTIFSEKNIPFRQKEIKTFYEWPDKLFNHLEPFANAKITDNQFRLEKYNKFLILAQGAFLSYKRLSFEKREQMGHKGPIYLNKQERQRFIRIFNITRKYSEYAHQNEKESFDYVSKNPAKKIIEYQNDLFLSEYIVKSLFYTNDLKCNNKFIYIFAKAREEAKNFLHNNAGSIDPVDIRSLASLMSFYPIDVALCKKCKSNPALKNYIQYIENKTGQTIK